MTDAELQAWWQERLLKANGLDTMLIGWPAIYLWARSHGLTALGSRQYTMKGFIKKLTRLRPKIHMVLRGKQGKRVASCPAILLAGAIAHRFGTRRARRSPQSSTTLQEDHVEWRIAA